VAKDLAAVQVLEQQAQQLKNLPSLSFDAAYQAVGSTTRNYLPPSASVHVLGDQVTVKLQQVPAHSVAQWLAALRHNAKALPVSTQLSASAGESAGVLWSGEVVLHLPPRE
jgi:general secretion pathway protein M